MASQLGSRSPQCLSCVRQLAGSFRDTFSIPGRQQIRGKKKFAKTPNNVSIRLLQHTPTYGRKGSILRVPPGLMRNTFYPKHLAEYITPAQLKALGDDVVVERDRTFKLSGKAETRRDIKARLALERGLEITEGQIGAQSIPEAVASTSKIVDSIPKAVENKPEVVEKVVVEKVVKVKAPAPPSQSVPDELSPNKAANVMSKLLPADIEFFRTPAPATETQRRRVSPSIPSAAVVSTISARKPAQVTSNKTVGSVSALDIAGNLNAVLAESKEGSRIVLSPENISFVGQGEINSVQEFGRFEINIMLEGAQNAVRRTVTVSTQE